MKKILLVMGMVLALGIFAVPTAMAAEGSQTAVVSFSTVLNESEPGKAANNELAELVNSKRSEVADKGKAVQELKKDFDAQAASLSAEDKKAKEAELTNAFNDYQTLAKTSNEEIQKKRQELRNNMIKEVQSILAGIASEKGYTMILDAANVPYFDKSLDVTAEVIQRYNASKK